MRWPVGSPRGQLLPTRRSNGGLQRLQPPTSAAHPVRESRAIDIDPVPGEDLALPIKREVIAVLADQDMGEKTRTGEALGDRTLRGGRLMNSPAGTAAIARPADADDPKPRGHMIEHLADRLADHMQFAAAAGGTLDARDQAACPRAADAPAGLVDRAAI